MASGLGNAYLWSWTERLRFGSTDGLEEAANPCRRQCSRNSGPPESAEESLVVTDPRRGMQAGLALANANRQPLRLDPVNPRRRPPEESVLLVF